VSPDRDWSGFGWMGDGIWENYVAATDGAQQRRVVFNPATDTDPVWSPIGNTVIYESDRDGNWNLYLLDLLTGVETRLTDDPGSDLNPFWAPDGVRVAFQSDRDGRWQIYELDLRTGETTRLSDGAGNDADPVYSFGGHRILFRSSRDGAESVIYLMNDDGSNLTRISDPAGVASNHTWSEDDALIAYQSDLDGDLDIYVYEVSSGITRLVTGNAIPDYAPTWYCAAQDVVFTSDVTDDPNLFMTPALPIDESPIDVASQARQLTDSSLAGLYPQNTPQDENASRQGDLP
jgi:Tol biopolymer transport system component